MRGTVLLVATAMAVSLAAALVIVACTARPPGPGPADGRPPLSAADAALLDAVDAGNAAVDDPVPGTRSPRWLGDGAVVFVEERPDGPVVVTAAPDGSGRRDLAPGSGPVPSPRGDRVAFADARSRLAVVDVATGAVTTTGVELGNAAALGGATGATPVAWSPDATRIAVLVPNGAGTTLRVVQPATGATSDVTLDGTAVEPAWLSPSRLVTVLSSDGGNGSSRLVRVDPATGVVEPVGPELGVTPLVVPFVVAARGTVVVARNVMPVPAAYQLRLIEVDPATGGFREVTGDDTFVWTFNAVNPTADGSALVLATKTGALTDVVRRIDLSTGRTSDVRLPLQTVVGLRTSPDGRRAVWVGQDLDGSRHVRTAALDTAGGPQQREVARPAAPPPGAVPIGDAREITWTTRDGVRLGGLLITPEGADPARPLPLWVDVHGGPEGGIGPDGALFTATPLEWQHRAAAGWAVFVADYRSSGVAGLRARVDAPKPVGLVEVNDVLDGVDEVGRQHAVDGRRMVLAGHSAGGGVAEWAAAHTDRFAAIVVKESGGGIDDEPDDPSFRWYFGDDPARAEALYEQTSPDRRVAQVRTPVLFLAGELPGDGSAAEMRPLSEAIRAAGAAPVEFVSFPGEGHVFVKRASNERLLRAVDAFVTRYAP